MRKSLYTFTLCAVLALVQFAGSAWAQSPDGDREEEPSDWQLTLGAGVGFAPDYEGSDDYEAIFLPEAEIVWKDRVSLSPGGLNIDAYQGERLTLGFGLGLTDSRDDSDNSALRGLGDIDTSAEGSLYASYEFDFASINALFAQDLGDGHEGAFVELSADVFLPVTDDLVLLVGPDLTWASEDYMQSFFGISSSQAASSAYSTFDADAGFKDVGLHAMVRYPLTESISLNGIVQYKRLLGDAADSPIVEDEGSADQVFGGMTISYRF